MQPVGQQQGVILQGLYRQGGCEQEDEVDICRMADDMQAYLLGTKLGTVSMALFTEGATVCNLWVIQARWCFRHVPRWSALDTELGT